VANERAHLFGDEPLTPESRRKLAQLYNADLRTMDDRLADLLAELDRAGVRQDTLIVLVSDHGEHLGEFDLVGHQHSVFDPAVSVPLAVQFPGDTGGRVVDEQVEIRRVFHTILDEAGVRSYPERSLASGLGDDHARGAFYSPMMEVGPPLWKGRIEYDPVLLGEPLSFVRDGDHKLVTFAGEEWFFELPESHRHLREADAASEAYERLHRAPAGRA
jgi:arylsulfatase A-like enzyme